MNLSRNEAKKLCDRVLAAATAADLRVDIEASTTGNTRFSLNQPTTTGDVSNLVITVTATIDGRTASASDNRSDEASIVALVRQAEALAKLSPPDPEAMPPLGPQRYPKVAAADAATSKWQAADRAKAVAAAVDVGKQRALETAGYLEHGTNASVYANKKGLFAYHESTSVSLTTTCRTKDGTGSGRAGFVSHRGAGLDARKLAAIAAEKAERSQNPTALAPAKFTVVLEPQAVADLMLFFNYAMSARSADEGRSYFAKPGGGNRIGEAIFDERVSLWSDPGDKNDPSSPIGEDGLPREKVYWVKNGVLTNLAYSRHWAQKQGKKPVVGGGSLFMSGGKGSVEDLIKDVKRGVLVTRFWYNRMLEPQSLMVTGLTRDGTFLIENGAIARSVNNFRYNESPITLLKRVVAMSKPERAGMSENGVFVVPGLVVEGFNFESTSEAV